MGEKNRAYDRFLRGGTNSERVQFFSDAVFAIAMTLLVIDIAVPTISDSLSGRARDSALWAQIGQQGVQFVAYAISFYVIAVNWMVHHRTFALLRKFDSRLVTINLVLLFFIAFVPYPTSLIAEYSGSMPAVILYASEVSIISGLQFAIWSYAYSQGFLDEKVDVGLYGFVARNFIPVPLVFLLSIPVGFIFGGTVAMFFWILNSPVSRFLAWWEPGARRRGRARSLRSTSR